MRNKHSTATSCGHDLLCGPMVASCRHMKGLITVALILLIGVIFLAIFKNPFWWSASVPLVLWIGVKWYRYKGRPWRRIHYPTMRLYSRAAGLESRKAKEDGREFDVYNAIKYMIGTIYQDWNQELIDDYINNFRDKCTELEDVSSIKTFIMKKNPSIDRVKLDELLDRFIQILKKRDNFFLVRMAIADIIEEKYSQDDRSEYIFELIKGEVN